MMRANCFNTDVIGCSYAIFRENFLTTFGTTQDDASLQWSFRLADSLTTDLGNLGFLRGQANAADFANEAIAALQSAKWSNNGSITLDRLRTVLEFQYYIMFLTPQERRAASILDFKPDQSLMDFASKLSKKVKDAHKAPTVPVAPVQVGNVASQPSTDLTGTSAPSGQFRRSPPQCTFCGKPGHKFFRCYKRIKQAAKDASQRLSASSEKSSTANASTKPSAQMPVAPTQTRATGASQAILTQCAPPQPSRKWCHVHEYGNHTTDECYTILRLKRNQVAKAGSFKPSGESSRPASTHPT